MCGAYRGLSKTWGLYDSNDQPTEAQIRDREGHIVSRFVRTYDANGRILEEKQILENPAFLMADAHLNAVQLEAMNRVMKPMLNGRSGTGITYALRCPRAGNRKARRTAASDTVTTISYNEHGDKSAEHETMTSNSNIPAGMASFTMDPNGTITPGGSTTEPTESPALSRENEVLYEYEYDSYGNWTQLTQSHSYGPDSPPNIRHRKLAYY